MFASIDDIVQTSTPQITLVMMFGAEDSRGVAHYLLGGIATTWAFFLARIIAVG